MDCIGLKMVGGEELLAKVVDAEKGIYSHVRQLVPSGDGVGLVTWLVLGADKEVQIQLTAIACSFKLDADVEKNYLSQVSGIQLLG